MVFPYFDIRKEENNNWFLNQKKFEDLRGQHNTYYSRGSQLKQ